jgi:Rps23 Pro-64 3,4-dihydroxylase Tpa1-like proline 4-hydroxylase
MIIVEENFNLLDSIEKDSIKEKCDNFMISQSPNMNGEMKNYYNRFTLNPNANDLKSISQKILSYTKEKIRLYSSDMRGCDIQNTKSISINRIDTTSNTNDGYHYDDSDVTFILYLNDEFEGGEFEYIDNKNSVKKIKPKKNMIIISNDKVSHRVLPVVSGIRYSLIYFFDIIKKKDKTLI